jgi:type IV pilus assembly protein PilB
MKIERKSMKLGDILVAHKIASQEDIESAIAEQKASGGKLGDILVQRGVASREDIFWALSNQFNISYMPVDKNQIDPQIVRIIPEEMARKNNILPLLKVANDLVLVVDDPMQFSVFEDVERLTGLEVNFCLGKSEETQKRSIMSTERRQKKMRKKRLWF